jgi:hypothetical protein
MTTLYSAYLFFLLFLLITSTFADLHKGVYFPPNSGYYVNNEYTFLIPTTAGALDRITADNKNNNGRSFSPVRDGSAVVSYS